MTIQNTTRARYICSICHMVEYCDDHIQCEFPPDGAKTILKRRHKPCNGGVYYQAGIVLSGRPKGQI